MWLYSVRFKKIKKRFDFKFLQIEKDITQLDSVHDSIMILLSFGTFRVVTSHFSFRSSRVIWSHFMVRVESSQSSPVQISMETSHRILLESLVMFWYVTRVWLDYNTGYIVHSYSAMVGCTAIKLVKHIVKIALSNLASFALHGGICESFHNKATIHASALHCVLWHMLKTWTKTV